jgi:hypothetical protein
MSNSTFLNSNDYRYRNAVNLQKDIANTQNDWYFFVGASIPNINSTPQPLIEEPYTYIQAWENMSFGKAIGPNNAFLMINNNIWQSNTIYVMYDDKDPNLSKEQFFVVENEGSFWHVWKCLDNNQGANSTIQPTFAYAESTPYYESSDGYRWKYMCSTDIANVANFATDLYFPLIANTTVASLATNGSIDIIKVQSNGQFYNNYLDGTFQPGDIITNQIFNLSNNIVQKITGYYQGCILYLSGGTGAGQFTQIVGYQCNTSGNFIQTANNFIIPPDNSTTYQIRPAVQVVGNGTETINCIARALINAYAGNSVFRVEVLQSGLNYLDANASVYANVYVGVSNTANVRPILPPRGGHGAHQHEELYCNSVGIYVFLSNTEQNTIPATAEYQQIGLMRNPLFTNVTIGFTNTTGIFESTETIYSIATTQLVTNVSCNSTSNLVSANLANFNNQLTVGEYVYISAVNATTFSFNQVANVVNSSTIQLNSNCLVTDNNAILYAADITGNGLCTFANSSAINVNACPGSWETGTLLVGSNSGATAYASIFTRNGINKSFNTFVQLYGFTGTQTGTFIMGETVVQGNTTAVLYGISQSNTLFQFSNFNNSNTVFSNGIITGQTSRATANINGAYAPELVFQSGDIEYLQNIPAVQRVNNQIETFQFVLNF